MFNVILLTSRLYKERLNQIDAKLEEMIAGRAAEYLEPLRQLQEQMHIRTQVAGNVIKSDYIIYYITYILNIIKVTFATEIKL